MKTYDLIDEDEMVEVTRFGDPCAALLPIGLDARIAAVRSDYVEGRIDVEEFEAETGRLTHKQAGA